MIEWIARILLVVAGSITSWFVARDALEFDIIQMVVAVLLFTIIVFILAFGPVWFKRIKKTRFKK